MGSVWPLDPCWEHRTPQTSRSGKQESCGAQGEGRGAGAPAPRTAAKGRAGPPCPILLSPPPAAPPPSVPVLPVIVLEGRVSQKQVSEAVPGRRGRPRRVQVAHPSAQALAGPRATVPGAGLPAGTRQRPLSCAPCRAWKALVLSPPALLGGPSSLRLRPRPRPRPRPHPLLPARFRLTQDAFGGPAGRPGWGGVWRERELRRRTFWGWGVK